jgi:hypothetical protein
MPISKLLDLELCARIEARWPTAEAFYSERDDRTVRLIDDLKSYVNQAVEIWIDTEFAADVTVQRIALIAANLTARWARRIRVIVPASARLHDKLHRQSFEMLAERLAFEMAMADPFGDFVVGSEAAFRVGECAGYPLRLFIGPWRSLGSLKTGSDDYIVDAKGWSALGRRRDLGAPSGEEHNRTATVAAAALAGSLGAADLFKRAVGHDRSAWMPTFAWNTWSSTLTFGATVWDVTSPPIHATEPRVDLGDVLLAGVGAIGSAFVYMLGMTDLRLSLTLFDRDRIDTSNLNRSPLFTVVHALNTPFKTMAAAEHLSAAIPDFFSVKALNGVWREHSTELSQEQFDVWLSMTNEDGAWAEIPFDLPPVVFQATTSSGWGFGAGRHIPGIEDCTLCRMPRPYAEFRGPCAEGEIAEASVAAEPIRASLPFLSTAAAALLLAEFIKLPLAENITGMPNDIGADVSAGLPVVIALNRGPTVGCRGCRALRSEAWKRRGGRGRFAYLSGSF